jgi:ATP-dependent 26S proteasome regulatory subunit
VAIDIYRVDRNKYQIQIPLPPKIDPSVTMMTVEEKPDVTYNDIGGCKEQIEKMREVSVSDLWSLDILNTWSSGISLVYVILLWFLHYLNCL